MRFFIQGNNDTHSMPRIVALITVCTNTSAHPYVGFYTAQAVFKHLWLIFFISTVEARTHSVKHANQILVPIFLTMKATILDTLGSILDVCSGCQASGESYS
jgi:hypothetical protein